MVAAILAFTAGISSDRSGVLVGTVSGRPNTAARTRNGRGRCFGVLDAARATLSTSSVRSATPMSRWSGDVNDVFPHKACINLDRDLESWGRLQAALIRHDIRAVRRVSAVDGSRLELPATWRHSAGAYGCLLSHLQVVRDARQRGLPSLLILEDDVLFDPSFSDK